MDNPGNKDQKFGKVQKPKKLFVFSANADTEHTPMEVSTDHAGLSFVGGPSSTVADKTSNPPKGHGQGPVTGKIEQTLKTGTIKPSTRDATHQETSPGKSMNTTRQPTAGTSASPVTSDGGQSSKTSLKSTPTVNEKSTTSAVHSPTKRPAPQDDTQRTPTKTAKVWTSKSRLNITPSPKKSTSTGKNVQYTRKYHACSDISDTFTSDSPTKGDYPTYGSTNSARQGRPSYMSTPTRFKPTSIQDLLATDNAVQVETQMTFNVVYLQEFMPKHPKVTKNRRRMVLADRTGCINAFILKTEDVTFDEGDTISIQEFKYNDRAVILHEGTVAIRIQPRDLPGNILEQAQAFVNRPKMPVMAIAAALRRPHLTRVAVEGTVIKIERPRVTTPKKEETVKKVVRDIKVQDGSGIVRMSLWEGAAIYCEVSLGDHIIVSDASVSYNGLYNSKVMNVQFPDMIIFLPPIVTTERMKVVGIDETGTESLFMFLLEEGSKFERLTVPLEVLLRAFNLDTEPTVRDLLPCLPFNAKLHINGLCVEDCTILSLPESAVMKTDDSQVSSNQFSDITDEELLRQDGDEATDPADVTFDNDDNEAENKLLEDDTKA